LGVAALVAAVILLVLKMRGRDDHGADVTPEMGYEAEMNEANQDSKELGSADLGDVSDDIWVGESDGANSAFMGFDPEEEPYHLLHL
jgi:hypothetical protein